MVVTLTIASAVMYDSVDDGIDSDESDSTDVGYGSGDNKER